MKSELILKCLFFNIMGGERGKERESTGERKRERERERMNFIKSEGPHRKNSQCWRTSKAK
jgi:hypothetical protein